MKWVVGGLTIIAIGTIAYFSIIFDGPRMRVQQHIRAYQKIMPHPPEHTTPVEPDLYAVPSAAALSGLNNPLPMSRENQLSGKVYYGYYCLSCHGWNGQGDGPVGYSYMPAPTDLHDPKVLRMNDGELLRAMLLGIGHEPVLPRTVLPGHRWYLVAHVRALGRTPREPVHDPAMLIPRTMENP